MAIKFTNKYNLPDSIVNAVKADKHRTIGDISVTQLIDAPQIRALKKGQDFEEDVMDRMWALMGTAVHHILELAEVDKSEARMLIQAAGVLYDKYYQTKEGIYLRLHQELLKVAKQMYPDNINDDVITEKTLTLDVDGMLVSGTFDRYIKSQTKLEDYKNCSVYQYIYPESRNKWTGQLNVYAAMIREVLQIDVTQASVTALFRDWKERDVIQNRDYPKTPMMQIPIEIFPHGKMMDYIRKRVHLHKQADVGIIAPCSGTDRWATSDTYAVTAKGRKRAIRVFPELHMAESFIMKEGYQYEEPFIQERPGENRRCDSYCQVRHICPQYKELLTKKNEE